MKIKLHNLFRISIKKLGKRITANKLLASKLYRNFTFVLVLNILLRAHIFF